MGRGESDGVMGSAEPCPEGDGVRVADGGCVVREARPGVDDDDLARLLADYMVWANRRLRDEFGVTESPGDPARVREGLSAYGPPEGVLLIAECEGSAVGTGALRRLADGIVEVKRMYVAPSWRDQHVGSAILDRLLQRAYSLRAETVRLDTCRFMKDAQRLYRSRGFEERAPYDGTEIPAQLQQHWLFFERHL